MDLFTTSLLSGLIYDLVKRGLTITAKSIKQHAKEWIIDDVLSESIEAEMKKLKISDEMSEVAIERRIKESANLMALIDKIKPNSNTTIILTHSGTGDNVAGDKTTYQK